MSNLQFLTGLFACIVLGALLWRQAMRKRKLNEAAAEVLFADLANLLQEMQRAPGESAGSWKAVGRYKGELFQFTTVVDTLATRKLPILWLLVTLPKLQPLLATFDLMMRPASPTTFSKFDFYPATIITPIDFPPDAVLRTDNEFIAAPLDAMRDALSLFRRPDGKELLLSPKGLRIVVRIAEADKARYGVFREGRFDGALIKAGLAAEIMNTLLQLESRLANKHA